jgi:hypothetical protein
MSCGPNILLLPGIIDPIELAPVVWFRADQGITTSSGNVTQWNDLSGNGWNLTTTSAPAFTASGTANGQPCVTFTGDSGQLLQNTAFNSITMPGLCEFFIVATSTSTSPTVNYFLIDMGSVSTPGVNEVWQQGASELINFAGAVSGQVQLSLTINSPFILDAVNNATPSSSLTINTALTGTSSIKNGTYTPGLHIGHYAGAGNFTWAGDVYEVIVYNYQLFPNQRTAVLNYLSARYGITI